MSPASPNQLWGHRLRAWVEALAMGAKVDPALDALVLRKARGLLRARDVALIEDVVSALRESLLKHSGAEAREWLAFEDGPLVAVFGRKLRRLRTETLPHRNELKGLRGHVRKVLPLLPDAPADWPVSIFEQDHVSQRLVARAVAFLRRTQPGLFGQAESVTVIASLLWARYGLRERVPLDGSAGDVERSPAMQPITGGYADVNRRLDADVLCDELLKLLTPREAECLALTFDGVDQREIATLLGKSLGTVNAALKRAGEKYAAFVDARRMGHDSRSFLVEVTIRKVLASRYSGLRVGSRPSR